ncbi:beta-ketoacyl-[acyl-carrier-protein] synthase family protein [Streptomyces sp. NPDC003016]
MSGHDIAVTGIGMVTPAGIGTAATWAHLLTGRPTAASDPLLAGLAVDFSCQVPGFDAVARLGLRTSYRLDRFAQMALVAAREAVTDAALEPEQWDGQRVGVVIGVGTTSMEHYETQADKIAAGRSQDVSPLLLPRSIPNMAAAEIGLDLRARGPNLAVSTACASGATALGVARDLLRSGSCDIVLAGGAESGRSRTGAVCFHRMGALSCRTAQPQHASRPFDADRDGFVLGEAAAVLVLERPEDARARSAPSRAFLAGYGASCDAHSPTAPDPGGLGAAQAIRTALRDARLDPGDIHHVNAHGTSTPLGDLAEYKALREVFHRPPPVTALKSILGHCMGAAGAVEAACTVLSLQQQTIPPTANCDSPDVDLDIVTKAPRPTPMAAAISNSFGFGGQNAALVFRTG